MLFHRKDLPNDQLLAFYKQLLWPRLIEEKMLVLLRQGRISKWFSGIGQEAPWRWKTTSGSCPCTGTSACSRPAACP
jgi:hypothetical protein